MRILLTILLCIANLCYLHAQQIVFDNDLAENNGSLAGYDFVELPNGEIL